MKRLLVAVLLVLATALASGVGIVGASANVPVCARINPPPDYC